MLISVDFRNIFGATSLSGRRESGGGEGCGGMESALLVGFARGVS